MTAPAKALAASRTQPSQRPRARLARTSRHPRVRWWRIANDHLWRLLMSPVTTWHTPEHRGVDWLDSWGVRIHRRTGQVDAYRLVRRGDWLWREPLPGQGGLLVDGCTRSATIGWLINQHAADWARLAGLPAEHINRQWNRLLAVLARRWEADGTLARANRLWLQALALDTDGLRLARATAVHVSGPDAVELTHYNRCLADRANLLTLEREAPQLMRLYALLLPQGSGDAEPKQALRQAFLAGGQRPPRLWRQVCRLDRDTVEGLTAHGCCRYMDPLADLLALLQALDLAQPPPPDWLVALRTSFGDAALSQDFDRPWGAPMLRAQLDAWRAADADTRLLLMLELEDLWTTVANQRPPPKPPQARRTWRGWLRWAEQAEAAQQVRDAAAARAWDQAHGLPRQPPEPPLRGRLVQLTRLLSSEALWHEGRAMDHCVHDWREQLLDGSAAVYAVHLLRTSAHIGTAAICRDLGPQVSGLANHPLPPQHRRDAQLLLLRERRRLWPDRPH